MRWLALAVTLSTTTMPLRAQHQECAETTVPATLPPAHEIIDSAAVISELRADHRLGDHMLFSLLYTPDDSAPQVSPMEGADPEAAFVLLRSIWPEKSTDRWAVRVRIDGDSGTRNASLVLQRSIYCPPVPERRSPVGRRIRVEMRPGDHRPPPGVQSITIKLEALIDEGGYPISVRITQSSGFTDMDAQIAAEWQTRKFKPALLDGRPIKAWWGSDRASRKL